MATPTSPAAIAMVRREIRRFIATMEPRTMSLPGRPRGEKPRTTIRIMQRHIRNLSKTIADLRIVCAEKDKKIAEYDVLHSEIENELFETKREAEQAAIRHIDRETAHWSIMNRLNFLEGYYAKSTEIFVNDPAKANTGERPGNTGTFQARPQTEGGGRQENFAQRTSGGPSSQIRGIRPDDSAHSSRGSVEKHNWQSP